MLQLSYCILHNNPKYVTISDFLDSFVTKQLTSDDQNVHRVLPESRIY